MKRRSFIKGLIAVPIIAAVAPIDFISSKINTKDSIHIEFDHANTVFKFSSDGGYIIDKKTSDRLITSLHKQSPFVRLSKR